LKKDPGIVISTPDDCGFYCQYHSIRAACSYLFRLPSNP